MYENSPAFHPPEPVNRGESLITAPSATPDDRDPADRLYPSMAGRTGQQPAQAKPTEPAPATLMVDEQRGEQDPADGIYPSMQEAEAQPASGAVPDNIRELREADGARRLYTPQSTYKSDIPDDILSSALTDENAPSPEVLASAVHELREMAADVGLGGSDLRALQIRARTLHQEPVPDHVQQQQTMKRLGEIYGPDGVKSALATANRLLDRDPRTKQLVKVLGLGNDPDTIVMVARAAFREQGNGRLK